MTWTIAKVWFGTRIEGTVSNQPRLQNVEALCQSTIHEMKTWHNSSSNSYISFYWKMSLLSQAMSLLDSCFPIEFSRRWVFENFSSFFWTSLKTINFCRYLLDLKSNWKSEAVWMEAMLNESRPRNRRILHNDNKQTCNELEYMLVFEASNYQFGSFVLGMVHMMKE